jgi:hypothetical protein
LDVEDLANLDANDLKSLADGSHAPKTTRRKVWLPLMLEIYHLGFPSDDFSLCPCGFPAPTL